MQPEMSCFYFYLFIIIYLFIFLQIQTLLLQNWSNSSCLSCFELSWNTYTAQYPAESDALIVSLRRELRTAFTSEEGIGSKWQVEQKTSVQIDSRYLAHYRVHARHSVYMAQYT